MPFVAEWHDTPEGALAAEGLALEVRPGSCALQRLRAECSAVPGGVVAAARRPGLLGRPLPEGLAPVAGLDGVRRRMTWVGTGEPVQVRVLTGRLHSRGRPPVGRVVLDGAAPDLRALTALMAQALAVAVPRATLAAQAVAVAGGGAPGPRAAGAASVPAGATVSDAIAFVLGHLTDVLLQWSDRLSAAAGPEPVHQMRVATRRMRSALTVFRAAAPCPELDALAAPVRDLAARLGAARDWDVFLDGTGARLAAAFPDDARCGTMLRAAARRQRAAYAQLRAVLAGPEFRTVTIAAATAAALRPWDDGGTALQADVTVFASAALDRRARQVRKAGKGLRDLPVAALHELRKDCKKLRYAAEFFSLLYPEKPVKRYLKRLAALQEELGLLNDGAAVAGLMAQLGRSERGYAAGLVEGFCHAAAEPARARILREWRQFRSAEAFWIA